MAKRTTKVTANYFRVNESLSGYELQTYTAAVFLTLGMLLPKSKGMRSGAISTFYNSTSIIRHHVANGNFERVDGRIKCTAKGRTHFAARITSEAIDKKEIAAIAKALRSGKDADLPSAWKGQVELSEVTILK